MFASLDWVCDRMNIENVKKAFLIQLEPNCSNQGNPTLFRKMLILSRSTGIVQPHSKVQIRPERAIRAVENYLSAFDRPKRFHPQLVPWLILRCLARRVEQLLEHGEGGSQELPNEFTCIDEKCSTADDEDHCRSGDP